MCDDFADTHADTAHLGQLSFSNTVAGYLWPSNQYYPADVDCFVLPATIHSGRQFYVCARAQKNVPLTISVAEGVDESTYIGRELAVLFNPSRGEDVKIRVALRSPENAAHDTRYSLAVMPMVSRPYVFRGLKAPRWVNFADPRPKGDDAEPPLKPATQPQLAINNVTLAPGVVQPLFNAAMPLSPADPSPLLSYTPPVLSKSISRSMQSEATTFAINAVPSAYGHCWADNLTPCLELNAARVTDGYDQWLWEHTAALQNAPAPGCSFTAPDDRSDATAGRAWSAEALTRATLSDHALTYWQSGLCFTNFALSDHVAETNGGRIVFHTQCVWPGALHDRNGNQLAFTYGGARAVQRAASWTGGEGPDASLAPVRPVARVANNRVNAELHSARDASGRIVALTNVVAGVPRRAVSFAYTSRIVFDPPGTVNDFSITLLERVTLPDGAAVRYEYTSVTPPEVELQGVFSVPLLAAIITPADTTRIQYEQFEWFGPADAQTYRPRKVTVIANNGATTQVYERIGTPEFNVFGGSVRMRTLTTTGTENVKTYDVYADRATRQWLGVETANTLDNHPQFAYEYDPLRLLPTALAEHDGLGAWATNAFMYDRFDNLTGVRDALGNVTRRVFAENGMDLLEVVDARGTLTTNAYDARGNRVLSVEDAGVYYTPEYMVVTTSYQLVPGVMTNVIDVFPTNWVETAGFARAVRTEYNLAGQPIKTIDPLGRVTRQFYAASREAQPPAYYMTAEPSAGSAGFLLATRDALGRVTTYCYDALGRQTVVNSPGHTPAARYVITNHYDIMDRLTATWFPDGTHVSNVYDAAGYLIKTRDRAGRWTTHHYDAAGHLVRAEFPNGDTVERAFCGDLVTALIDGRGNVTRYFYDHEQVVGVEFPDGTRRAAGFDMLNRQLWAVDERGVAVTNVYDALGRLVFAGYTPFAPAFAARDCTAPPPFDLNSFVRDLRDIYPAESLQYSTAYTYDENGNVTSYTDWLGTTSHTYDALNRVQSTAEGATVAAIGDRGHVAGASRSLEAEKSTSNRDRSTLKRQEATPVACHWSYAYDLADNRTSSVYRISNVQCQTLYAFDPLNRLTALAALFPPTSNVQRQMSSVITASYTYHPNGKLAAMTAGTDAAPRYTKFLSYDAENRLSQIAVTNALNQPLWSSVYAYNTAQQITQITEQASVTSVKNAEETHDAGYMMQDETVAAIADRGVATATVECGSEAAALSEGAQLPYEAKSARNRDGSFTIAAENLLRRRGGAKNVEGASRPLDAVESTRNGSASAPVTRSGAALAEARSATDMQSRRAGTDVPTMSGLATLHVYTYDARDQLTNELRSSTHPLIHSSTSFSYDHAHNRIAQVCQMSNVTSRMAYSYLPANKLETISLGAAASDDDSDGLSLEDELRHGTDRANPDTDGDGLSDGTEVNVRNTNPWNADSDGDNIADGSDANPLRPDGGVWFGASNEPWPRHFWLQSTSLPVRAAPTNAASHLYYYDLAGNLVSSVVNGVVTRYYYNAQNKLTRISGAGFSYEFLYDGRNRRVGVKKDNEDWRWDIHDGNVCVGQMQNGTMRKFFVRGLGIAEGTGDVIAEMQDAGYKMQDGEREWRLANSEWRIVNGGSPAPATAAAVAAIGDRGVATATLECGSEAAAFFEGAQLPNDAKSTRNRDGSATVAAIGDRGNVATAVPSRGNHCSAVASAAPDAPSVDALHFYVANHRGDTVLAVSEGGVAEMHMQYDVFGNVVAKSGSFEPSYTFSTKEYLPGAKVYLYAYRVYDPRAGRWTQRDPIDYQDSVNLYQFCGNNAANVLDVDGQWNVWNPATWGVPNAPGWSVAKSFNPFDLDTAAWNAFSWHEVEKGAAAALDGIIPFFDPMEIAYADEQGNIGSVYELSRHIAAFSRDIYLMARIPNLREYLKNPRLYEKGCSTVPNALYDKFLQRMNPVEKGRWLLQYKDIVTQYMTPGWRWAAYARTWNTGLTPGGRLFVIVFLLEPSDALSRVE